MIKSKYTFYFILYVAFNMIFIMILLSFSEPIFHQYLQVTKFLSGYIFLLLLFLSVFFSWIALFRQTNQIEIDTLNKTILFRNLLFFKTSIYKFREIEGYFKTTEFRFSVPYKYMHSTAIYIVKDNIIVKKIAGFCYSNLDEILDGLGSLNSYGYQYLSLFAKIKFTLGMKVTVDSPANFAK